jgi:anti-sigma regulatory factor (Ser/Thr protein kinase)
MHTHGPDTSGLGAGWGHPGVATAPALLEPAGGADTFCHEALFHDGDAEFVDSAMAFIEDGLGRDEAVLVVVTTPKLELLRSALGATAGQVHLADMTQVGRNPTRIISAWGRLLAEHGAGGRRARGIGEPVWPGRSEAELVECGNHESLLNLAFAGWPAFWLLCPYDTGALDRAVVDEARRNHPTLINGSSRSRSHVYRGLHGAGDVLDGPLSEPAHAPVEIAISPEGLADVRRFAADHAVAAGFDRRRVQDVVLAVSELATNTVIHGGGHGVLRTWRDGDTLVHEVRDPGVIREPLVGRQRPAPGQIGGRGLWLVNEVCDLVQLRSSPAGTVVRVHLRPH